MFFKKNLVVFPTTRSVRTYIVEQKNQNSLLPFLYTIDEFFKKVIFLKDFKYCDEEYRIIFLHEAIKNVDVKKLGISSNFTKFFNQSDYIYRFFLELASEKINIDDIQKVDTYEFYASHLEILKEIRKNYLNILERNNFIDKISIQNNYEINIDFINKFEDITINFEGYFTKVEFELIEKISQIKNLNIKFYSNEYNQKSLENFKKYNLSIKNNYKYEINLSNKTIIFEEKILNNLQNYEIKGFSSRLNQIAYIKSCVEKSVNNDVDPSKIALVLPDESFFKLIELFDDEKYFNFAMGKSIINSSLYQKANAIYLYLQQNEEKDMQNLQYLEISKDYIDINIKNFWNKQINQEQFSNIIKFIQDKEDNVKLLEKFEELIYKFYNTIFTNSNQLTLKDIYKIFMKKLSQISLDDINSGKITVLGLLETRMVSFDTVIICDFNESFVPKISIKDKFLSTKLKQISNLPTKFDRESLQKYYYKRLITSSKNVFISYVNSQTNSISRFANELFNTTIKTSVNDNLYKHILYDNRKIEYSNEDIIFKVSLDKFIWSASSLKIFLECKRKFYFQYIQKLKEHSLSIKPKSYELGNIVHLILEEYYLNNTNTSIEDLFLNHTNKNPFLILDLEIWKKKIIEFLKFDKKRLQKRSILMLEKEHVFKHNNIQIKVKIDRVDKYNDIYEVIDYKTSSSLIIDSLKTYEKSCDFQLEFYYLAVQKLLNTSNIKTYYCDLNKCLFKEEVVIEEKLELLNLKFQEIKDLSKEEIDFNKCEDKSYCIYCSYKTICNR